VFKWVVLVGYTIMEKYVWSKIKFLGSKPLSGCSLMWFNLMDTTEPPTPLAHNLHGLQSYQQYNIPSAINTKNIEEQIQLIPTVFASFWVELWVWQRLVEGVG
ncbi:unnamed protein product, partial [Prunus brigantina]